MRSIWLALTLLIGVGALTAITVSVATPTKQPTAFSSIGQVEADLPDPSLAKGDKLQVSYAEPPSKKPVQSIPIVPPVVAAYNVVPQKIISRHWHVGDPVPAKRDTQLVRSEAKPKK
jgi:hypothetical protein